MIQSTTISSHTAESASPIRGKGFKGAEISSVVNIPTVIRRCTTTRTGAVSKINLQVGGYLVTGLSGITYRPMDSAMSAWQSYNGLVNTISYDSDLRPTSISVPGVQSLSFAYDAADRLTKRTNGMDATMSQSLGYDALSRLTSVSSSAENESYTYDADGNRLSQNVNGIATTYQMSAASNQLFSSASGGGSTQFNYDAQGNLLGGTVSAPASDSPTPRCSRTRFPRRGRVPRLPLLLPADPSHHRVLIRTGARHLREAARRRKARSPDLQVSTTTHSTVWIR